MKLNFVTRVKKQLDYAVSIEDWIALEDASGWVCGRGYELKVAVDARNDFYSGITRKYGSEYAKKLCQLARKHQRFDVAAFCR
jgi:hypothetical protein